MFFVTGKLSDKAFIKTGTSDYGKWTVIQFLITKKRKGKTIKIPITAKGKLAEKLDNFVVGEKLRIEFFIEGKEYNSKFYTECYAISIEKYVKKQYFITHGNEMFEGEKDIIQIDNHIFKEQHTK